MSFNIKNTSSVQFSSVSLGTQHTHFDTNYVEATLSAHRVLNYQTPIFHDDEVEKQFNEELAKALMKGRLAGNTSSALAT